MASLFGSQAAVAPAVPETSMRVQTSIEGLPRTLLWGKTRISANIIWYGDFKSTAGAAVCR